MRWFTMFCLVCLLTPSDVVSHEPRQAPPPRTTVREFPGTPDRIIPGTPGVRETITREEIPPPPPVVERRAPVKYAAPVYYEEPVRVEVRYAVPEVRYAALPVYAAPVATVYAAPVYAVPVYGKAPVASYRTGVFGLKKNVANADGTMTHYGPLGRPRR